MQGKSVELIGTSMKFGDFVAVHPSDLSIDSGVFYSILGPSGCGKTTLLRLMAGFLNPSSGEVKIGGELMNHLGPNKRPTAMIFQNLALFPLMSVWENIAYGLKVRGKSKSEQKKKADELLELIALTGQGDKKPDDLSGGQRQRVAIARALAVNPAILLLDEPLSALDLKLRQHMRTELKNIQKETGVTFIYITHDQGEALTMSDEVAVMNQGKIEQIGTPDEIYNMPKSTFAASFVGENNLIRGKVIGIDQNRIVLDTDYGQLSGFSGHEFKKNDDAFLFVRPELSSLKNTDFDNRFAANVINIDMEGAYFNIHLKTDNGMPFKVHQSNTQTPLQSKKLSVSFQTEHAQILPPGALADE